MTVAYVFKNDCASEYLFVATRTSGVVFGNETGEVASCEQHMGDDVKKKGGVGLGCWPSLEGCDQFDAGRRKTAAYASSVTKSCKIMSMHQVCAAFAVAAMDCHTDFENTLLILSACTASD